MDFFRWLHPIQFDARVGQNRFKSIAFKNSSGDGGGLSAVECICVENKSADTNDDCHYNIVGVGNKCLKAIFINHQKNHQLSDFSIVDGGTIRALELTDMK